jgi:putative transposase
VERVVPNALSSLSTRTIPEAPWTSRSTLKYPGRLYHKTPGWVARGALFHVRIRALSVVGLTNDVCATELLQGAQRYHDLGHWWCELMLIMPDHVHVMLAFPDGRGMSEIMRDWKRCTARLHKVNWQEGYFDHRLRNNTERGETWAYIRRNPVVNGLCATENDWPHWWSALSLTR